MPFIGRWKFLTLNDANDSRYQQALFRLRLSQSRDTLLDLGCGLGQALRQFRDDGVDGSRLFGLDSSSQLISSGYDLFQDRSSLGARFTIGDITDPDDLRLDELNGHISIIHAGSFFHLFSWKQQLYIGKRLVGFLQPEIRNAFIYGRHVGVTSTHKPEKDDSSPYLHNQESFQRLWDEIGELTRTKWKVEVEQSGENIVWLPGRPKGAYAVNFTIYQVPRNEIKKSCL
ncbi:uncharacterized protein TrAFT101_002851 [Trichoderma asperellum]|nr:hypothetical protein TrAFT101_002851 [Trichoderma asperellum]